MADISVEVKRVINAPIERVYQAWIDPEQLKQWHRPHDFTVPEAFADARTGGKYSITMMGPGGEKNIAEGVYKDLSPPNKLVMSWDWQGSDMPSTQITVNFNKLDDTKTEIILLHEHFISQEYADSHKEGWDSALDSLVKFEER